MSFLIDVLVDAEENPVVVKVKGKEVKVLEGKGEEALVLEAKVVVLKLAIKPNVGPVEMAIVVAVVIPLRHGRGCSSYYHHHNNGGYRKNQLDAFHDANLLCPATPNGLLIP